jgi:hypothetical protein
MWGQVSYIGDPDEICLAGHICLSTHNFAQHKHLLASLPLCRWFRFAQLAKGKKFRP